jgi:hypothetical protein
MTAKQPGPPRHGIVDRAQTEFWVTFTCLCGATVHDGGWGGFHAALDRHIRAAVARETGDAP